MKSSRNLLLVEITIAIGVVLILVAATWGNYRFAVANPGGNDFLVHWVGTRSLIVDGLSPYSDETAIRIQTMAYGRPAVQGEHEMRVAYPLYSVVFFMPFALVPDFTMARALWMTLLETSLVLLAFLSIRMAQWRPGMLVIGVLVLFSVLWYHGFRPLINGNAVILVALFIVSGILAIRSEADELAGVLLAFSTIKPQVVVVFLVYIVIWAIAKRRGRLIVWMVGTIVLLSLSAMLLIPDWILQNLREVLRYPGYNPPGTPGTALATWFPAFGVRFGWVITALITAILLVEWWITGRGGKRAFVWAACLTLAASPLIGIQTDPGNFVTLYMPLILVFSVWEERWKGAGRIIFITTLLGLFFGLWALFLATVSYEGQPIQSPVMFFPAPLVSIVGLYWVRWWAIRPASVWYDMIYERENR
ncbi:MAG TPA: glycosyltransferase family 87 protein [Anaerolineaceae bacterium]